MENESLAYELLSDMKKSNKRMFIVWIITFLALIGVTCYTIYLLNDIEYTEETIQVDDFDSIDGSDFHIGDNY